VTVIVLAKAPLPGRVKTRLCPPCDPEQAARLAEAALVDTLRAVAATRCRRRVLVLDGAPGPWLPAGFEVVPQRGDGLDERLANAFTDVGDRGAGALLIGMDTPQLTPARLTASLRTLEARRVDAVLGPAVDGGWWGIGLRAPDPDVFLDVPMSTPYTGAAQRARLRHLRLRTRALPRLRDVDDFHDAIGVARAAPRGRFAATLRTMLPQLEARDAALAAR
jgi:rSAM/selenodomain-associated transferase 1